MVAEAGLGQVLVLEPSQVVVVAGLGGRMAADHFVVQGLGFPSVDWIAHMADGEVDQVVPEIAVIGPAVVGGLDQVLLGLAELELGVDQAVVDQAVVEVAAVVVHMRYQAAEEVAGKARKVLYSVGHTASRQRQHLVWSTRKESSRCQASAVASARVVAPRSAQLADHTAFRRGLV